tara:strand:+ start:1641 stop:2057 length:417 start_codon:yes stop_codon:yes gene_type:complete
MNKINPLQMKSDISGIIQNNRLGKLQNSTKNVESKNLDKIKELSEEFESLLLYYALKSMREAVPKTDLFHSNAEDIFTSMLDQEISKNSVKKGSGLGLARIMQQQLTNRQNQTLEERGVVKPRNESKINYHAVLPKYR